MSDRTAISVDDLGYIFNYFRELSPAFIEFALLLRGVRPPEGPLRYLELGFGQGTSINIHAAANTGIFWGNDHNPQHVAHAQALSDSCGSDATLLVESFAQLLDRTDLPEFNVVALHGIWTWVSEQDRVRIVEIARRCLAPGGVLYVSYNCMTAWAALIPLRHLLMQHAQSAPSDVPLPQRALNALLFAQSLIDTGALHFKFNPIVTTQIAALRAKNAVYLAHEFFGSDWQPMNFADVAKALGDAGLSFAGSTMLLEDLDVFAIPAAGRPMLAAIDDVLLRETARDLFMNTRFREDLFVKSPRLLTPHQREEALLAQRIMLAAPLADIELEAPLQANQVKLDAKFFAPILASVAKHGAPISIGELREGGAFADRPMSAIIDEVMALVACRAVHIVRRESASPAEQARCEALNRHIISDSSAGGDVRALASAVLGGGVMVTLTDQLLMQARSEGCETPVAQAEFAWARLSAERKVVHRRGVRLYGADENLAELARRAEQFETEKAPLFRAMGVLPG